MLYNLFVMYRVRRRNLHRFVCALTLSQPSSILITAGTRTLVTFLWKFHILYKSKSREPAFILTVHRISANLLGVHICR